MGPNLLFYCYDCSLPIIVSKTCPICKNKADLLQLTPPFDVRPAKAAESLEIQELIENNFGNNANIIHKDDILLLNHVGSEDHLEEIILYGNSIGTRRYDLVTKRWIIKLNANGLSLLNGKLTKNWVKVGEGAKEKIMEGASILIPGVLDADPDIENGNYIAVVDNDFNIIAGGIARIDEKERKFHTRGVYAKNYLAVTKSFKPNRKIRTWEEIVKLNEHELIKLENKAFDFIRKIKDDLDLPVMVSFSGGKDSLVTYSLVQRALPKEEYKVLFVDTGIEFPETVNYVKENSIVLGYDDKLIIESVPTELFWDAFDKFGPPGRDFRHCCKYAKLAPIQRTIKRLYQGNKVISFVGQRRYESFQRSISDIWENSYVSNQINASPIQNWTALMIWFYILWKKLPYNPLYDSGYERIGCWVCPSSDMAQFEILQKNHPELYNKLSEAVERWRKNKDLPESYAKYGLWRFKKIPRKIASALSLEFETMETKTKRSELSSLEVEASDCVTIPLSIIGSFSTRINLEAVSSALLIIGRVQFNRKLNFIRIFSRKFSIIFYSDSTFKISFRKQEELTIRTVHKVIEDFVYTVLRALECINCELCVGKCEFNAISINNNTIQVDKQSCTKCLRCSEVCPIVTIVHKDLRNEIRRGIKQEDLK